MIVVDFIDPKMGYNSRKLVVAKYLFYYLSLKHW